MSKTSKGVLLVMDLLVLEKLLIARAVAGEANVPFFYQSGASFVHIYVGMGLKGSRTFAKAKQVLQLLCLLMKLMLLEKQEGKIK